MDFVLSRKGSLDIDNNQNLSVRSNEEKKDNEEENDLSILFREESSKKFFSNDFNNSFKFDNNDNDSFNLDIDLFNLEKKDETDLLLEKREKPEIEPTEKNNEKETNEAKINNLNLNSLVEVQNFNINEQNSKIIKDVNVQNLKKVLEDHKNISENKISISEKNKEVANVFKNFKENIEWIEKQNEDLECFNSNLPPEDSCKNDIDNVKNRDQNKNIDQDKNIDQSDKDSLLSNESAQKKVVNLSPIKKPTEKIIPNSNFYFDNETHKLMICFETKQRKQIKNNILVFTEEILNFKISKKEIIAAINLLKIEFLNLNEFTKKVFQKLFKIEEINFSLEQSCIEILFSFKDKKKVVIAKFYGLDLFFDILLIFVLKKINPLFVDILENAKIKDNVIWKEETDHYISLIQEFQENSFSKQYHLVDLKFQDYQFWTNQNKKIFHIEFHEEIVISSDFIFFLCKKKNLSKNFWKEENKPKQNIKNLFELLGTNKIIFRNSVKQKNFVVEILGETEKSVIKFIGNYKERGSFYCSLFI